MSLSNSRWNQEPQQQANQNNRTIPASTSKYIPPHSVKPKPRNQANEHTRKSSSNIIITNGDRQLSKKFTNSNQNLNPTSITQADSKLIGLVNSFDRSNLSDSHLDPMSLVPSPSRGIYTSPKKELNQSTNQTLKSTQEDQDRQHHPEQDLTNLEFQVQFFKWIVKRIQEYKKTYPDRIDLFLYLSLKDPHENLPKQNSTMDHHFKTQIDRISSLVREIKKLREGIFASGRRDSFAILVYELSAELALESLDFAQLNTLLNHLILDLYRNVPILDHSTRPESETSANGIEGEDVIELLHYQKRTKEEVLNRRLMFARVLLLLPIATRLDLSRFIEQYAQVSQLLGDPSLQDPNPTHHSTQTALETSTIQQPSKLLELDKFFKLVLRRNYVQLNRKFIKPKLEKIFLKNGRLQEEEDPLTEWDDLLFLVFLNLIRSNLIWKVIQKSYYHLSLEDDRFIFDLLSLDFQTLDQFRRSSLDPPAPNLIHQLVNSWLLKLNIQRNSNGFIQFK